MDIYIIFLFLVIIWGIKRTKFNDSYIDRDSTTAIKGIFAIIILFSHSRQYLPPPIKNLTYSILQGRYLYDIILDSIGQLMVVMFLLYSGYGIMESYKKKRDSYLKGFLKKRVLKTVVHFDIAVALFVILALVLGHKYLLSDYIWSWIGWTSIGNSNWFVFDIIILYLLTYIAMAMIERNKRNEKLLVGLVFLLSFLFIFVLIKTKECLWWYDTVLAFPTGMFWSVYRNRSESFLMIPRNYYIIFFITFILFLGTYYIGHTIKEIFLFFSSAIFGILVVLVTMKLKIGNSILNWLGINAFAIYILQRLAMIVASEYSVHEYPVLFLLIVISATLILSATFTTVTNRIDAKYFK